jgi:ATP-dependent Lhr-like helicase
MDPFAADELVGFLNCSEQITQTDLPHRHHLLIEHFDDPLNKATASR